MKLARRRRAIVSVLVVVHVVLAVITARSTSVTVDEAGHLASGVAHHQQGTFASYRVNPPPARWLATLPVMLLFQPPLLSVIAERPGLRPEGAYGAELATSLGPRYPAAVFTARLFGVALSALALLLVYAIGARTMGVRSGLIAAGVYAFDVNVIAHASVLTSDLPALLAVLAVTWALLRYGRRPTRASALVLGALLGAAQLTKFSLLVLYPVILFVLGVVAYRAAARVGTFVGHTLLVLVTSLLVLNAGYAFVGSGARLDSTEYVSHTFTGAAGNASGNRFRGAALGAAPLPLPRDYVQGIDLQRRDFEGSLRSYLNGRWHGRGFWFFYAYTLALKTPLPTLALLVAASAAWFLRRRGRRLRTSRIVLLAVPLSFFVFVSSQTGFSHHLRYVLPVLPFVALAIGSLGPRRLVLAGVLASAVTGLFAVPHALSYFNVLGGGWQHGDAHLVDSNIDWGQDLGALGTWYRTHHDRPLRLAYFGGVDPHIVGLEYTLPPTVPEPGRYVLSVNFVRGMRFAAVDGASHGVALEEGTYAYFSDWEPTARIGTSIRVYDVTREDANAARRRRGLPEL